MSLNFKLYLITDRKLFTDDYSLFTGIEDALKGGVKAVQLREKDLEIRDLLDMAYEIRMQNCLLMTGLILRLLLMLTVFISDNRAFLLMQ